MTLCTGWHLWIEALEAFWQKYQKYWKHTVSDFWTHPATRIRIMSTRAPPSHNCETLGQINIIWLVHICDRLWWKYFVYGGHWLFGVPLFARAIEHEKVAAASGRPRPFERGRCGTHPVIDFNYHSQCKRLILKCYKSDVYMYPSCVEWLARYLTAPFSHLGGNLHSDTS